MENRQLIAWSRKLYQAIVDANLPPLQLRDIAEAIRARKPWPALAPNVKLAIMKISVGSAPADMAAASLSEANDGANVDGTDTDR